MSKAKFFIVSMFLVNNYLFCDNIEKHDKNNLQISSEQNIQESIKNLLNKNFLTFLTNKKSIKEYYLTNNYKPFWINENGLKDISFALLERIENDPVLKPQISKNFKINETREFLISLDKSNSNYSENLLKAEFMLTEIFDKYSNYLINGSINWQTFQEKLAEIGKDDEINAQWDRYQIKKNPKEILKNAVINNDLSLLLMN